MEQKFLINCDFVRSNSNLSLNIEDKFITSNIQMAQDIDFQQIIGTNLYNFILTQFPTFDVNITALLEKFGYYYIMHSTIFRTLLSLNYKVNEIGITKQNTNNSVNLDLSEFNNLRGEYKNNMEFYGERLTTFLLENDNIYTQYLDNTSVDEIQPGKSYFCGIQPKSEYRDFRCFNNRLIKLS